MNALVRGSDLAKWGNKSIALLSILKGFSIRCLRCGTAVFLNRSLRFFKVMLIDLNHRTELTVFYKVKVSSFHGGHCETTELSSKLVLLVCKWRHGGHVGSQEQKHFSPLGNELYFDANLAEKFLLFWPPTWPPCHVVANQELKASVMIYGVTFLVYEWFRHFGFSVFAHLAKVKMKPSLFSFFC